MLHSGRRERLDIVSERLGVLSVDEAQVIGKVLGGNVDAYGVLVRRYAALLTGTARHLICNRDDAEDLAQEALLDAYTNLSTLRDRTAYRAWVFAILRFKCRDYLRRRKPEALNLDDYADAIPAQDQATDISVKEMLEHLPLQDREILSARYIQDLDYREIAEILGISEQAARMRCSRARTHLRAATERSMRQAMGAFLAAPLTVGFGDRVLKHAKQTRTAPGTASVPGPVVTASGISLKAVAGIVTGAILASTLLFLALRQQSATPPANVSAATGRSSMNQTSSNTRSGRVVPKIIATGEMILVGTASDGSDIAGTWVKFEEKEKDVKHKVGRTTYEWHAWNAHECMVAVEVTAVDAVPEGMSVMRLPAAQYAVFTHRLANGGYTGLNSAMDNWLATGPYEQVGGDVSIQVFDDRFKGGDQPDSEIDFWIPVRPRA